MALVPTTGWLARARMEKAEARASRCEGAWHCRRAASAGKTRSRLSDGRWAGKAHWRGRACQCAPPRRRAVAQCKVQAMDKRPKGALAGGCVRASRRRAGSLAPGHGQQDCTTAEPISRYSFTVGASARIVDLNPPQSVPASTAANRRPPSVTCLPAKFCWSS